MHVFMLLYIFYQNFQKQTQQDAQGHEGPALKEQKINLITDYYILFDGTRSLKLKKKQSERQND